MIRSDRNRFLASWTILFLCIAEAANLLRGTDKQGTVLQLEEKGTRFFARYSDWQGRRLVQKCARAIFNDEDDTDYTVFDGDSSCFDLLKASSLISSVEEDHPIVAFGESPVGWYRRLGEQVPWGIEAIQADQLKAGKHNVTVCIVDSGIAPGHPDFVSDRIRGKDRTDKPWEWSKDRAGHGTHVAGTIAAATANGLGVRGVGVFDLVIVRALSDEATGHESDIYLAVQQCIAMGADVINLSLGSTLMSDFARELYTSTVEEDGIIMVAAAGNNGDDTKNYPASHPSVISVGAVDQLGKRFFSSVYNNQIELVAPGNEIISTSVSRYALKTDDFSFPAERVVGPPNEARTGKLAYCDFYDAITIDDGGICLFNAGVVQVGDTAPDEALARCAAAGGVGAVFFTEDAGLHQIAHEYIRDGEIPAICISRASGMALLQKLDEDGSFEVTIGDEGDDNIEYTYDLLSGTSMASPHVAASAALLKSHFYGCTASQIRYALAYTAEHPSDGCNEEYGYGVIKVKDAYDWLDSKNGCSDWDVKSISRGGCTTLDLN